MAKNDFQYGGWNNFTPCNVARSWHWFRQVTAPCNVHVALESWQWIHQVAGPCNVIRGSGMTCHWIRPNVRHIGILHLVSISTTSPPSTCHSAPVSEIFIPIRPPSAKKMTSCRFSRWRISAILDFRGPIMGSHVRLPIGRQYRHIGLYGLRPPFLAVPDVIAHPSTASVPITVLLYDDPLLCGFNVVIKGLKVICLHCTSYYVMSFVRTFIRCQQCPAAISYLSISDKRVLFRVENTKHITELLSV